MLSHPTLLNDADSNTSVQHSMPYLVSPLVQLVPGFEVGKLLLLSSHASNLLRLLQFWLQVAMTPSSCDTPWPFLETQLVEASRRSTDNAQSTDMEMGDYLTPHILGQQPQGIGF
jgi:hypothetical protein